MINFNFSFDPRISLEQRVGFQMAAAIWSQFIADDIDVNLQIVSSETLGEDGKAIGGAAPVFQEQQYGVYQEYLKADASQSQPSEEPSIDEQAVTSLQTGNTTDLMVNGEVIDGNTDILLTSAQAKALGMDQALTLDNGTTWTRDLVSNDGLDGAIFVSQKFDWSYDFTRTGEAPEETIDFLSMALHEIGHQLGFVSSLDGTLDVQELLSGDTKLTDFTALDLFRHSSISSQILNPDGSVNDLSVGGDAYFSIDGGATNLGNFATGQDTSQGGDGQQASHWQRLEDALGIMDPTLAYQERLVVQERDLQALDVLGYEVNYGLLQQELDLNSLLLQAQNAVEVQMGIESGTLTRSYGGGENQDLYELGYSQWWQLMESQMLELGYSQWWQIYELGYSQWWQQYEQGGEILELGYSQWWQEFEAQILELGYSQWWQEFEDNLLELGYSQWWQLFELGYSQWWQEVETFFAKVEPGDTTSNQTSSSDNAPVTDDSGNLEIVETIASEGDDIIGGSLDNDIVLAGAGDDLVDGAEGNDILIGNTGADTLFGWDGEDILLGGEGNDRLIGEKGNDELQGELGDDLLSGGDGNDHIDGGEGQDQLYGDAGRDILLGRRDDDFLSGGEGNDIAVGEEGRDVLHGGAGDDRLYGDRYTTANNIIHDTADFKLLSQLLDIQLVDSTAEDLGLSGNIQPNGAQLVLLNATESELATAQASYVGKVGIKLEAETLTWEGDLKIGETDVSSDGVVQNEEKSYWFWSKPQISSTFAFTGETGLYDVVFGYHDLDGTGEIRLSLGERQLGEIQLNQDFGSDSADESNFVLSTLQGVSLTQDDLLTLEIEAQGDDKGYLDYLRFLPTTVASATEASESSKSTYGANTWTDGISFLSSAFSILTDASSLGWGGVASELGALYSDAAYEASSSPLDITNQNTEVTPIEISSETNIEGEINSLLITEKSQTNFEFEAVTATAPGSDILRGGDGDDQIYGGEGNDQLYGDSGNDFLVGSDRAAAGLGELDVLTGGSGQDDFVLGDSQRAYYSIQTNNDYAIITDFDATLDQVILHGSDYRYSQQQSGNNLLLQYRDDLIAVFQNLDNLDLAGNAVQFI